MTKEKIQDLRTRDFVKTFGSINTLDEFTIMNAINNVGGTLELLVSWNPKYNQKLHTFNQFIRFNLGIKSVRLPERSLIRCPKKNWLEIKEEIIYNCEDFLDQGEFPDHFYQKGRKEPKIDRTITREFYENVISAEDLKEVFNLMYFMEIDHHLILEVFAYSIMDLFDIRFKLKTCNYNHLIYSALILYYMDSEIKEINVDDFRIN